MDNDSVLDIDLPEGEGRSFEELHELAAAKGLELEVIEPAFWRLWEAERPVGFVDGSFADDSLAAGEPAEVIAALDAYEV